MQPAKLCVCTIPTHYCVWMSRNLTLYSQKMAAMHSYYEVLMLSPNNNECTIIITALQCCQLSEWVDCLWAPSICVFFGQLNRCPLSTTLLLCCVALSSIIAGRLPLRSFWEQANWNMCLCAVFFSSPVKLTACASHGDISSLSTCQQQHQQQQL